MKSTLLAGLAVVGLFALAAPSVAATDWAQLEQILGRPGAEQPGDVRRFGFPRSDLEVTLDAVAIKPGFALGSWAAFHDMGDAAMVMGDLVLTQDELAPVMAKLVEGGLAVTAVHHHIVRAEPMPVYMHIEGHGDAATLATTIREALELTATPLEAPAAPAQAPEMPLDTAALDQIMGHEGKVNGAIFQYNIPRAEPITENGMEVPASMGLGIAINFQPTDGAKAAITGDFVLTGDEVAAVMQTLIDNGIEVTSLHNHMVGEEPRLYFMHFWANDDAAKLAEGLRAALEHVAVAEG